jgi:hypothetical protein
VVANPSYYYDPKFQFKGVRTHRKLTIAPGPNNPVGLVWIDLTKPSYGIHGTPRPEEIGKTRSHGCIRLTNWDALDLAKRVRKGTPVVFLDETQAVSDQKSTPHSGGLRGRAIGAAAILRFVGAAIGRLVVDSGCILRRHFLDRCAALLPQFRGRSPL